MDCFSYQVAAFSRTRCRFCLDYIIYMYLQTPAWQVSIKFWRGHLQPLSWFLPPSLNFMNLKVRYLCILVYVTVPVHVHDSTFWVLMFTLLNPLLIRWMPSVMCVIKCWSRSFLFLLVSVLYVRLLNQGLASGEIETCNYAKRSFYLLTNVSRNKWQIANLANQLAVKRKIFTILVKEQTWSCGLCTCTSRIAGADCGFCVSARDGDVPAVARGAAQLEGGRHGDAQAQDLATAPTHSPAARTGRATPSSGTGRAQTGSQTKIIFSCYHPACPVQTQPWKMHECLLIMSPILPLIDKQASSALHVVASLRVKSSSCHFVATACFSPSFPVFCFAFCLFLSGDFH